MNLLKAKITVPLVTATLLLEDLINRDLINQDLDEYNFQATGIVLEKVINNNSDRVNFGFEYMIATNDLSQK